jgi:hypothetical protein
MAIHVLTNASLVYNSVDLSVYVTQITVTMSSEDVDITGMGATARAHAPGLRDDRIEVTFLQDFAAAKVDATIYAQQGGSGATMVVKPTSSAVSATNPSYTMTAVPFDYTPIDGAVGEADTVTVTFLPGSGAIVRATS